MHPLIITPLYPPAVGGAATYYSQIAVELVRRQEIQALTILTERYPGQPRIQQAGKLTVLRLLPTRIARPQRVYPIHAATYTLNQAWFITQLSRLVQMRGVDLVHFHTRYASGLFPAAVRRCSVPTVADLRDKLAEPAKLAGMADRLICCCEGVYQFALAGGFPPDRADLVPLSFTPPASPTCAQIQQVRDTYGIGNAPYLLFVGDVNENKGVLDLLQAYSQWRSAHPDVALVVVGVNRLGKAFQNQVNATEGATYLGSMSRETVLALMSSAEMVVLPSRSEGLPRVILEAMALGRKVVAPPHIPEFNRHIPEFVLPQVDVATLVETLERVWLLDHTPSFPFSPYCLTDVVDGVIATYAAAIR